MHEDTAAVVGLDLGDRRSHLVARSREDRRLLRRCSLATTRAGLTGALDGLPRSLVILETGTHSPWVAAHLASLRHQPLVANARELAYISRSQRKSDETDAEKLLRLGFTDPPLLKAIQPKDLETHRHLTLVRARVLLVRSRTRLVNGGRGMSKALGDRVRNCSTAAFPRRADEDLETAVRESLDPVLGAIEDLTLSINEYDRRIAALCETRYPETRRLTQVPGVGDLLALAYVLTVGDPGRFRRGREVGPFFGLVPRRFQSGEHDPELGITKTGDRLVRALLVQSAHYILGPFGPDCDLRRWAKERTLTGGQAARCKILVAVARKLAVLLYHLWVDGEEYRPLRVAEARGETKPME